MKNENNNSPARESIVTMADIAAVAQEQGASTADPMDQFPALKAVAHDFCAVLGMELAVNGVPVSLANRAAGRAYHLAALAAQAMHRAIWNAVLPAGEAPKN